MQCPCGTNVSYDLCCGLFIDKHHLPQNAEALMRSRYSAYSLNNVDYIVQTMRGKPLMGFSKRETADNNALIKWGSLEIIEVTENTVEFKAIYTDTEGNSSTLHEKSLFKQKNKQWYYIGSLP